MTAMRVDLPWPARILHPNARVCWAVKAKAVKRARQDTAWAVRAIGKPNIKAASLSATIIFSPPDRRRRDLDSMLSAIKAHLDGIADAVGVDDSLWTIAIRRGEPVTGGNVRVELEVQE
jgi:crossover junction endodeoxyribonuclease RusA